MNSSNNFLRELSIRFRMQGAVAMVLGLLTLFGLATAWGLAGFRTLQAQQASVSAAYIGHLGLAQRSLALAAGHEAQARAEGDAKSKQGLADELSKAREALDALAKTAAPAQQTQALESAKAVRALEELAKGGDGKAIQDALTQVLQRLSNLSDGALQQVEQSQTEFATASKAFMTRLIAFLVLAGLVVWPLTLLNSRSIEHPIAEAKQIAEAIASGDLSAQISQSGRDEAADLLRALGHMQDKLRGMVGEVRHVSDSLGTAAEEIANGNHDLSARTEQTASNLQSTASSMGQLTDTVRQSADSARTANQLASSAAEVAQRGGSVVSQVVSTMEDINNSSKKIADIISVIDGIAFQTNILALNAAVEAARAGEQGRGFAVVASEVRSLAGRSADAAKEIKALIGASVDKVETGSKLVQDAGSTMTEIVASVQRVSDIIGEISAASAEQSEGINGVNGAINQLDQMTQQNAALVEESAAAAESLKDQAARLAGVVSGFKLDSHGSSGGAHGGRSDSNRTRSPLAAKPKATSLSSAKAQAKAPGKKVASVGRAGSDSPASKPRAPASAFASAGGDGPPPASAASPLAAPTPTPAPAPSPAPTPSAKPSGGADHGDWESF